MSTQTSEVPASPREGEAEDLSAESPLATIHRHASTDGVNQTLILLRREQAATKQLRCELKQHKEQLDKLRVWQGSPAAFEADVAAAIQHAKEAEDHRDDEILRLREEVDDLRSLYETPVLQAAGLRSDGSLDGTAKKTVPKLEEQLRRTAHELQRSQKELIAERVKSRRALHDLDITRASLQGCRDELSRLYDELARARAEVAQMSVARAQPSEAVHRQQLLANGRIDILDAVGAGGLGGISVASSNSNSISSYCSIVGCGGHSYSMASPSAVASPSAAASLPPSDLAWVHRAFVQGGARGGPAAGAVLDTDGVGGAPPWWEWQTAGSAGAPLSVGGSAVVGGGGGRSRRRRRRTGVSRRRTRPATVHPPRRPHSRRTRRQAASRPCLSRQARAQMRRWPSRLRPTGGLRGAARRHPRRGRRGATRPQPPAEPRAAAAPAHAHPRASLVSKSGHGARRRVSPSPQHRCHHGRQGSRQRLRSRQHSPASATRRLRPPPPPRHRRRHWQRRARWHSRRRSWTLQQRRRRRRRAAAVCSRVRRCAAATLWHRHARAFQSARTGGGGET